MVREGLLRAATPAATGTAAAAAASAPDAAAAAATEECEAISTRNIQVQEVGSGVLMFFNSYTGVVLAIVFILAVGMAYFIYFDRERERLIRQYVLAEQSKLALALADKANAQALALADKADAQALALADKADAQALALADKANAQALALADKEDSRADKADAQALALAEQANEHEHALNRLAKSQSVKFIKQSPSDARSMDSRVTDFVRAENKDLRRFAHQFRNWTPTSSTKRDAKRLEEICTQFAVPKRKIVITVTKKKKKRRSWS
jgi:hypothetical protein